MWSTLLLSSLISSTVGVSYTAHRRIYPQTTIAPLCGDYIEVTFTFDDTSNETTLTIFSSTNTSWFGIGFPETSEYYDPNIRRTTIMNGYAIVYINDTVQEYNITSTDNNGGMDSITPQATQNIAVDSIDVNTTQGTVTITLRRNLTTTDGTDFVFNLAEHIDCRPILMTVAMGDAITFTANQNSFGSSYVYLYETSLTSDTSVYNQSWTDTLGTYTNTDTFETFDRPFAVTLSMDPSTDIVDIIVEDGPSLSAIPRAWSVAFPDLADTVYYASDPVNMQSDYAIMWGHNHTGWGAAQCVWASGYQTPATILTEARLPIDGADCLTALAALGQHTACWDPLPNPQKTFISYANVANVKTFEFQVQAKSCGYHFNPYEFQTCRPLTMVSMAMHKDRACFRDTELTSDPPVTRHCWNSVQIDDFPTRAPTKSPSKTPSAAPTQPSAPPTTDPTQSPSTANPTLGPTDDPTSAPSQTPTAKPTDLPTVNRTALGYPDCPGMQIKHLGTLFSAEQSYELFNQIVGDIYNRRRVWDNGRGLVAHYSNRFADWGDWVITNGTYSAISLSDANFNNSLVYNTTNLYSNPNSLPGPYPSGYVYYDHFAHDNIFSKPDQHKTLFFACHVTAHPTLDPTPSPVTSPPSAAPTTAMPTMAPTQNCTGFSICEECILADGCNGLSDHFIGDYLKGQDAQGKAQWTGVDTVTGYTLFYSEFHQSWVIHGGDGYNLVAVGTQRYPPLRAEWGLHIASDPFMLPCVIELTYNCSGTGIPTKAPTRNPTTAVPTTGAPSMPPSAAPSFAPTNAPSRAPTIAPTAAPTGSPISECLGFAVQNSLYMDGLYGRSGSEDMESGRWRWHQIKGDGEIFWSLSPLHQSWIIYSNTAHKYWLSSSRPNYQPSLFDEWNLYSGASPFVVDTREITLSCSKTLPPTADPTVAPSVAPTDAPSFSPSIAPTQPPSIAPTNAPTKEPTPSPSTLDPTSDPTVEPTFMPTDDPTAEPCKYLVISNPDDEAVLAIYEGVYEFFDNSSLIWIRDTGETCNGNRCNYEFKLQFVLRNLSWVITNKKPGTKDLILSIPTGGGVRPPYAGTEWKFSSDVTNTDYSLNIDCARTDAPSTAPTLAPSFAPTMAPTSSCKGLYFNNTEDADFAYNGWYNRQEDYLINGKRHWVAADLSATIAFIHGHWYLSEKDNNNIDDEDPIMLLELASAEEMLSPPSGDWWMAYGDRGPGSPQTGGGVYVEITCMSSRFPTESPSGKPSESPTIYVPPSWEFCPDSHPYFAFINASTDNTDVYWPMPVLNEHIYDIDMTVDDPVMVPGVEIDTPGMYTMVYTATDDSPRATSIECSVVLYVIGGGEYDTEFEYCKRERFNIEVEFNNTYYLLADDEEDKGNSGSHDTISFDTLDGSVYDPMLQKEGQNCYVTARQVSEVGAVEVVTEASSSTFLGIEATNAVWEVLVLLLILILFALIADCLYGLYKDKKAAQNPSDAEQTEQLLAESSAKNEEILMDDEKESEANGGDVEMQKEKVDT